MSPAGLVLLALGWSALVWAGASLICRMKPAPKLAQAIWRGAALMLAAPFAASLIVPGLPAMDLAPLPDVPMLEPLMIVPQDGVTIAAPAPAFRLPEIGTLVLGVLAAGWLARFALWLVSQVRLQRIKVRALRTNRPVGHWAEALGLTRVPEVRVIPRGSPFLAGVFKRSVYVPSALIRGKDAQQVIVHELVHLKRGDLITRPLERIVADLFWFSPFAWGIRDQLDFWREAVVDDETVELTGDRIAYARTLTTAARISRDEAVLPVAAFILRKKGNLKMRLNQLLTEKTRPRRLGLVMAAALACAAPLALAQGMLIKGAAAAPGAELTYSHAVLDEATLTSAFGKRKHPITGEMGWHNGVDLAAQEGTPVYAPTGGIVTKSEMTEGYGNLVVLRGAGDRQYRFGQLQELKVQEGDVVNPGDIVGLVGQTGQATGPHLHFEVWHGEKPDDPQAEEGLVLADSLFIRAGSGAKAPVAPASSAAPEAPDAPDGVQFTHAAAPAPPAQPAPDACFKVSALFAGTPRPESWTARQNAARAANQQAGVVINTESMPFAVSQPRPYYPQAAIEQSLSGSCLVAFDLGTDGVPRNKVAVCSDPVFEESAAELKDASFAPILGPDGKPVEVMGLTYPLEYCIEG
jgi:murein DD-endopeptidase MepM/ murein hydrolase activator NlpD